MDEPLNAVCPFLLGGLRMKEKEYKIDSRFFQIHTTGSGIVAACVFLACIVGILMGFYPKLLMLVIVVTAYTFWNTFIAISNPQKVFYFR